jgi:hypothetical protein
LSCSDYLDVERYFNDRQDLERIFNSRDYTEQWLANAYYQLLSYNLEIGHVRFTLTNYSDDMIFTEGGAGISYSNYKFGQYGPQYGGNVNALIARPWDQSYEGIRQASIFLQHVHPGAEISAEMCDDLKGQAYFIRGYLYWLLLRKYGPVPILPDEGLDYEAPEARTTNAPSILLNRCYWRHSFWKVTAVLAMHHAPPKGQHWPFVPKPISTLPVR